MDPGHPDMCKRVNIGSRGLKWGPDLGSPGWPKMGPFEGSKMGHFEGSGQDPESPFWG